MAVFRDRFGGPIGPGKLMCSTAPLRWGDGLGGVASDLRTQEVDDLLDEIDEVLEDNAEEFVRSYVQKGGQ